ncbi:MAG: Acyl carrier protein phosphodiesterase [Acidimicrobiaceae bacterium]|jgi:FMN-dependent NADH-azoreductase|nr:Acyl carrier protein phosphodiesterase [Acidimicrobiaceae bacterium]
MTLFRLDASIRVDGSASREIADIVEAEWRAESPDSTVIRRHVGTEPLPSSAWGIAATASYTPAELWTPEQIEATALAATLVDELEAADAYLFAVPLYNFGVSQHFKSWIDLVIADPRMGAGAEPLLAGRPAVLVTVHGGNYAAGTPREGWDHASDYYRRILADVWQLDLRLVEREFTLVGVVPALDEFTEVAAELRVKSHEEAHEQVRHLLSGVAS